jgi:uncharacterized protein (DUF952 family)
VSTDALFHIATPSAWEAARSEGVLAPPSLALEGFVHCSTADQLDDTIERHFGTADALVLLRLRDGGVDDALRWEESRPGEPFPHVYRAIGLDEVAEVIPWHRSDA